MNTEEQIEIIITKYLSKKSNTKEKEILFAWLNVSEENKKHFLHIQNIWHVSNPAFKPEDIDTDKAYTRILRNMNNQKTNVPKKESKVLVWWQKVAAILLIPILAFTIYQNTKGLLSHELTAYQEITSPLGMKSEVTLPDGSIVWLNSGSKLKYPLQFNSKKREVYLSGEAYFEVQSDKFHPFIVSTQNLSVVATGTIFNVEAYYNDTITAVTLLEGKVGLDLNKNVSKNLLPNQRFIYNTKTNKAFIEKTDANSWCKWKDGILAFRNEPLEDVFKRIGRNYNVDILIKDKKVAKQMYRATFEGESLDEILHLLKLSAPIKYKRIAREQLENYKFKKEIIEVYSSK